jgi:lipoyl(octanoyl) transferase 2
MRLRHLHIPSKPPFILYAAADRLQEHFRRLALHGKIATTAIQPPTLISFTPQPTFTLGRRQHGASLDPAARARLRAPLEVYAERKTAKKATTYTPEVIESPRGGLTTYHGPGQLVLWPIVDLRSPEHANFGVRDWACTLEKTTIAVLERLYGLKGFRTDDPGVWLEVDGERRKVAAMGVALRRYVSSLGVAINVDMPGTAEGGQHSDQGAKGVEMSEVGNPWLRFVPCGLEGKAVTSVSGASTGDDLSTVSKSLQLKYVAQAWAIELARRLDVGNVEEIAEHEVLAVLRAMQEDDST